MRPKAGLYSFHLSLTVFKISRWKIRYLVEGAFMLFQPKALGYYQTYKNYTGK